ncbi:hypothetical protein DFH07DRAFT_766015 [Mycena maculata]|uniref:Uncharacterized protein n=1 Tax=Mycena maculata TaxID=230809 RepID=A0AAD7K5L1_9AGAR|nr:hypothetical protein DFH07DRAFT_766015 [Mycena maculata]
MSLTDSAVVGAVMHRLSWGSLRIVVWRTYGPKLEEDNLFIHRYESRIWMDMPESYHQNGRPVMLRKCWGILALDEGFLMVPDLSDLMQPLWRYGPLKLDQQKA